MPKRGLTQSQPKDQSLQKRNDELEKLLRADDRRIAWLRSWGIGLRGPLWVLAILYCVVATCGMVECTVAHSYIALGGLVVSSPAVFVCLLMLTAEPEK